ncbi:MAG: methyltransferase domain-containing protein [Bryobacteraceae bacterium]|nr:methyltransferase domain-containing protein [Bryobacteraceae bacterium]
MITAAQEQRFYDSHYRQFLDLPDHALRCDRASLLRDLNNPAHPIHERRKLYEAVLNRLLQLPLARGNVLDYGCGPGEWGLVMAGEGARVTFLDLSPVAIELCLRRAAASSVEVRGCARDASDLSCFPDGEFDLVYANAALHHTLKYPGALDELVRVIRPGGRLILAETYGNNPLLNAARRLRWKLGGQAEEQGEDILLGDAEIDLLRGRFARVEVYPLNFLAMAKRLFRGRLENPLIGRLLRILESADDALLGAFPGLRRYCGEVLVEAER